MDQAQEDESFRNLGKLLSHLQVLTGELLANALDKSRLLVLWDAHHVDTLSWVIYCECYVMYCVLQNV